jgi:hypothetical protein
VDRAAQATFMTAHTAPCQACGERILGEIFHLGFSDMDALYCSSCPSVLLLKDGRILERHGITWPDVDASKPGFQFYCRHLLPVFAQIEALFRPCACGGHYGFMNPPRCPQCLGLLRGDVYEDKPILKLNDGYVFVTVGSVDDRTQLRRPHIES